jgi:hypothetical protein
MRDLLERLKTEEGYATGYYGGSGILLIILIVILLIWLL